MQLQRGFFTDLKKDGMIAELVTGCDKCVKGQIRIRL